jgi:hypothetical protein
VSGRVSAIEIDPNNPNNVYVGAAQGGVYRSLDGGATDGDSTRRKPWPSAHSTSTPP